MIHPSPRRIFGIAGVAVVLLASGLRAAGPATTQATTQSAALEPGNTVRKLTVDGRPRSYIVHVPPTYDAKVPTPVVLAFHGAYMNAAMMIPFCGLSQKADAANFVVVYPNGTGFGDAMLFFNAWARSGPDGPPDDVKFTAKVLDDLEATLNVDKKRIFATGMSNGGMMCHRLGAELADRIAAIAPVAGTIAAPDFKPTRPIPVMHFHGTADTIVAFDGKNENTPRFLKFKSVDATIKEWIEVDGCPEKPSITDYPTKPGDTTSVQRKVYGPGKAGTEVVLIVVEGGGHTWPGRPAPVKFMGRSTTDVSANDLMWDFFQQHPMK